MASPYRTIASRRPGHCPSRRLRSGALVIALAVATAQVPYASAQTVTTSGYNLALRSNGTRSSSAGTATLTQNGYVGTYISLAAPSMVTLAVRASGQAGGGAAPRMSLVVGDASASWDVGSTTGTYTTTLNLAAGTHLVRSEFVNDVSTADRRLTVQDLQVTGASVVNSSTNANALAAADTYIANGRKGVARVTLPGAAAGSVVQVRQVGHAFRFGTAVPGFSTASSVNTLLRDSPTPGSTAANYQQRLLENFNSVTPSNAGKWASNESTRNVVTLGGVDRILDYAQANGLRVRQHNLIWGSQQPTYVNNLVAAAVGGDASARATLDAEIAERIDYSVRQRATRFDQLDVYNESFHTGQANAAANYWQLYGPTGIASIHNRVADAVRAAGAATKLFTNEYNVLNENVTDPFANYYRAHVDALREAGGQVDGVGIQYYAHNQLGTGAPQHNAARAYATLANMSVGGLPIELTEFGIKADGSGTAAENAATAAQIQAETMRLVFGSPSATGFTQWGFWAGDVWDQAPAGALFNADWSLTEIGAAYRSLMAAWTTNLSATVGADGAIAFDGFYGDYEIVVDGQSYAMTHEKGTSAHTILVPEPVAVILLLAMLGITRQRRLSMPFAAAASK
jgi:GH35 family endo-1,4-beta-xylanase